jgi:hypothetical protein
VVKAALEESRQVIKALEDRIAHLESPAPSRVLANGVLPPAHMLRGQDEGTAPKQDATYLRKQLETAPDSVSKEAIAEEMRVQALAEYNKNRPR